MRVASTQYSVVNQSFEIYLSGCDGYCGDDCHNKELWNFDLGKNYKTELLKIISKIVDYGDLINAVWLIGGEPLLNDDEDIIVLANALRVGTKKPLYLFTRFEICDIPKTVRSCFDYIKCGCYNSKYKDDNYYSEGVKLATTNQKIYKVGELNERL